MSHPDKDDAPALNGLVIWVTGLPGSGKSTLANGIKECFPDFTVLRMDELRKIVTPDPSYSDSERDLVYRSLVYTAMVLSTLDHGVIIDATAHMRKWRDLARQLIPRFLEFYLKCPLPVCAERERSRSDRHGAPKDIYTKGTGGWPVPGINVPYEEPLHPDLIIDTDKVSPKEAIAMACKFVYDFPEKSN